MFETLPVQLTAFFTVEDEVTGYIRFAGDNYPHLALTLIQHTGADSISLHFRSNEASPKIDVQDRDVLIILATQYGRITASQIFEVDLSMPLTTGMLLIPRGGYNVICQQEFLTEEQLAGLKVNRLTIEGPMLDKVS